MAGNTASQNIEGFVYTSMNALYQTNLSFTSQNIGAEKYTRIKKILATCQGVVVTVGLVLGFAAYLGGPWLLQVYSEDGDPVSVVSDLLGGHSDGTYDLLLAGGEEAAEGRRSSGAGIEFETMQCDH